MVFQWSFSNNKSEVSRTLLGILADLSNAVVWIASIRPLISKSSSPFSNPLMTIPRAPITIGITVTFMSHSFFNSLARSRYLSFFSLSFNFILWSARIAESTIQLVLYFFFIIIRSGRLAEIRWSVCISKSLKSLCPLFLWINSSLDIYHLFVWSNLNFLHHLSHHVVSLC